MTDDEARNLIIRNRDVFRYDEDMKQALTLAIEALAERPQGKWKIEETPQYSEIRCPFCQFSPNEVWLPNFCSNCGAKMFKGDTK